MNLVQRLLLLIAVAILPAVLIQLTNEVFLRESRLAELQQEALRKAQQIAGDKSEILGSGGNFMQAVFEIAGSLQGADCDQALGRLEETLPRFRGIGVLDPSGAALCRGGVAPEVVRPLLPTLPAPGTVAIGAFGRTPTGVPVVPLARLLGENAGVAAGIGYLLLDLEWLSRKLDARPLPAGSTVTVTDDKRQILARAPFDPNVLGRHAEGAGLLPAVGGGAVETTVGLDGIERMYAVVPLDQQPAGLYVVVGVPVAAVLGPIEQATRQGIAMIALGALAALVLGWMGARRLLQRPLQRLAATAERWRAGDYAADPGLRKAPAELRHLGAVLDDAIGALAERESELRRARQEADRANVAKSRLMAAAGHDLKQPLQAIMLTLAAVMPDVTPAQRRMLEMAGRAAQRLGSSLDTLVEASRLESGQMTPERGVVPLRSLLSEVRDQWSMLAADKGLALRVVDCDGAVVSDRRLLATMVNNLVANAVRYTDKGGIVVGCRRAGASMRLVVADSGIGIPADKLADIFEEYRQVDPSRRQGFGLGLSIVRRAADLLGHRVTVTSEPGRGTVFAIELPLAGAVAPVAAEAAVT